MCEAPPPLRRLGAVDRSRDVRASSAAVGTTGWADRDVYDQNAPRVVALRAAASDDWVQREAAAGSVGCPAAVLGALIEDSDKRVDDNAARNPGCPPDALWRVMDMRSSLRSTAAMNPRCPQTLLACLASGHSAYVRGAAARRVTSPDVLRRLAGDNETSVRTDVAANTACPSDVFERLADDEWWRVRVETASNPACPPDLVGHVIDNTPGQGVHEVARRSEPAGGAGPAGLPGSPDSEVRATVAGRESCPPGDSGAARP